MALEMKDVKRMGESEILLKSGWWTVLSTEEMFQLLDYLEEHWDREVFKIS